MHNRRRSRDDRNSEGPGPARHQSGRKIVRPYRGRCGMAQERSGSIRSVHQGHQRGPSRGAAMRIETPGATIPGEQEVNRHTMQTCDCVCDPSNKILCPIKNRRSPRGRELQTGIDLCVGLLASGQPVDETILFERLPGRRYRGKNCLSILRVVHRTHQKSTRLELRGNIWCLVFTGAAP